MPPYSAPRRVARAMLAACCAFILSGCELELPSGGFATARQRDQVLLAQSGLSIAGPVGYCVDQRALNDSADRAFVLMVNCDALRGRRVSPSDDALALLTASASPQLAAPTTFDAERLAVFFASQSGRAALSRTGEAETITLIEDFTENGIFFVHARDSAPNPLGALSDEYWRAVMIASGRLVSLTVTPYSAAPLSSSEVRKQTRAFAQAVWSANEPLPQSVVSE